MSETQPLRHWSPGSPGKDRLDAAELAAFERVERAQAPLRDPEFVELLGAEYGQVGQVPAFYAALLQSPIVAEHISDLGRFYRTRGDVEGSFSHVEREWVTLVLAQELGCTVAFYAHLPDAIAVGVRLDAVKAMREAREQELSADDRELLDYTRRFATGTVTAETYGALETRLGVRGALELTGFLAHLAGMYRLLQAFGHAKTQQQLDGLLEQIGRGELRLPDARARVPSVSG